MVGTDVDVCSKEVNPPFMQCLHNCEHFLLVYQVVSFSVIQLSAFKRHGSCCFPNWSKCQNGTCSSLTSIACYKDLIFSWVFMVDGGKAVPTHNRCFMLLNAYWCTDVHCGKFVLHSFRVSRVRIAVCSANVSRNTEMYLTRPRNWRTCVAFFGAGQFRMHLTFELSASMPCVEMWWLRKSISVVNKVDFFSEQYSSAFHRASRIS